MKSNLCSWFMIISIVAVFAQDDDFVQIDWSKVIDNAPIVAETVATQLQDYVTCSCDVTRTVCDVSCCCDNNDCTSEQKRSFDCATTTRTTAQSNLPFLPRVLNPLLQYLENYFLLVHTEITPYIGEFYSRRDVIRNALSYSETMINESVTRHTVASLETVEFSSYKYGTPVKTVNAIGEIGNFLIPQTTGPGTECNVRNSPVRFGQSKTATCFPTVSLTDCRNGSVLDANIYYSPKEFSVLSTSDANSTEIPAKIRYFCAGTVSSSVRVESSNYNSEIIEILTNQSSMVEFDERQREPETCESNSPTPDVNSNTCKNVATDLTYNFLWQGQSIVGYSLDIGMKDVPLDKRTVQNITIVWKHRPKKITVDTSRESFTNHGFYTIGTSVWATNLVQSKSNKNSTQPLLTANSPDVFQILKASRDGLCKSASLVDAQFGVDAEGACFVRATRQQFADCSALRLDLIESTFKPMLKFNYLLINLKTAINQTSFLDNLVEILTENEYVLDANANGDEQFPTPNGFPLKPQTWPTTCRFVPAHLTVKIQYAETSFVNGTSLYEIVGSLLTFTNVTWLYTSTNAQQNFLVTNRVLFTKVPSKEEQTIKFYLYNERPSCFNAPSLSVCWEDLFYAFTSDKFSVEDHVYGLVAGLASVLVLFATYFVTKPWF